MDYKYIEQLIERYFEGETSLAEERILKAFFSQNEMPAHLKQYADIFIYEDTQMQAQMLDESFDQRLLARLEADGNAPVVHVKIQKLTFADRLRPLWRAAAAVAIVALVGSSIHKAYVTYPIEPISQYGTDIEQAKQLTSDEENDFTPQPFTLKGEKVAITTDTIGATTKAN